MQPSLDCKPPMCKSRAASLSGEWIFQPAIAASLAFFALAILLLVRRATGAIHEPLPTPGILFAGIILCSLAAAAHWSSHWVPVKISFTFITKLALTFSLFAVGATLSLPGTSSAGLILFWAILILEEGWVWQTCLFRVTKKSNTTHQTPTCVAPAIPLLSPLEATETVPPEEVTQQLTRSKAADGTDEFAGWLRVLFASNQRTRVVHLAFCPPFQRVPELHVEQLDGPEVRIKTAQVLPYGARIDLKLSSSGESSVSVLLRFFAHERE
jgi:hypothetical protein